MRLVLFGTGGNQAYIFASNRLREAVGASYLISELTTTVVRQHAGEAKVVQSSSGSAVVVTETEAQACALVRAVTGHALRHAPGLSVLGVHMDITGEDPTPDEIAEIHQRWRRHAAETAGSGTRWPRLPVVAAFANNKTIVDESSAHTAVAEVTTE